MQCLVHSWLKKDYPGGLEYRSAGSISFHSKPLAGLHFMSEYLKQLLHSVHVWTMKTNAIVHRVAKFGSSAVQSPDEEEKCVEEEDQSIVLLSWSGRLISFSGSIVDNLGIQERGISQTKDTGDKRKWPQGLERHREREGWMNHGMRWARSFISPTTNIYLKSSLGIGQTKMSKMEIIYMLSAGVLPRSPGLAPVSLTWTLTAAQLPFTWSN